MPVDAAPIRAEQMKLLAELTHQIKTSREYESCIKALMKAKGLQPEQEAAVRVFARDFMRQKSLPAAFVQEFTKHTNEATCIWNKAKETNNFRLFMPILKKTIDLMQRKADYIGYKNHPYDALVDEYEPGITTAELDTLFSDLKDEITPLVKGAKKGKALEIKSSLKEQLEVCHNMLEAIGYNFNRGRLDTTSHPFCQGYHPFDIRITCRSAHPSIFTQMLTTLHEAGHAFYEMGLPPEAHGTPLGTYVSLGIHESQSRFWETRIGRSEAFWKFFLPKLKAKFKKDLGKIKLNDFMSGLNFVQPSFIRTDADEVTYPLHVILRYEIEKELLTGELHVKDLPERWNSSMKELLGITPKTDTLGCLQDIHWSVGFYGYFPTYTLGNIYAAQMFEVFSKKFPTWESRVASGDFDFIHTWLSKNIWSHGSRYDAGDLIRKISGKALTAKPYISYLTHKYC
jgi:carboxypeptidase Taq